MILRDVDLATCQLKKGKRDNECVEFRKFGFQTSCVGDLYARCLPKLVTKETGKVLIDLTDEEGWVDPSHIQRLLSTTISPWRASLAEYWQHDEFGRKLFALEALHGGLMWLAEIEGWPTEPLVTAYHGCRERELVNAFYCKKTFPNLSKTATIKLFCEFGPNEAKLYAVVMRRRKELRRVFLGSVIPSSTLIWMTVQSFSWINDHAVQIKDPYFVGPREHDFSSVLSSVP